MKDERIPASLERRIASALHATAPHPAPDLADRVLRHTAAIGQRRRWGGVALASALAAATAAAVAIVVIGLQLGGMLPGEQDLGSDPSAVAATPSPSAAPASGAATPARSPSQTGFPGGLTCANDEFGFTLEYPADWWANEAVVPDDPSLTPIPACTYFAEEPVELQPNAGLPGGIAVIVDLAEEPAGGEPARVEVIERRDTEVGGRPAVVEELEWTEDTVFQRAGDRIYAYRIDLADGRTLAISTSTYISRADAATYAEHRDVLDRMMEGLRFIAP